jgi:DNA mismatch repair protein MutS
MSTLPSAPLPERDESTPLLKQYWELKSQVPDGLLLFRMGDFYELFGEDAVIASQLLDLTLTSRDKGKANPLPMAGMPFHAAQSYIQKLLDQGKKVAIGEQTEDPEEARKRGYKSIVRREIVRVLTPAVQFDLAQSSDRALFCTALLVPNSEKWVLAAIEPSTGESFIDTDLSKEDLFEQAQSLPIRHFLRVGHALPESVGELFAGKKDLLLEEIPTHRVQLPRAKALLREQFEVESLEPFLPSRGHSELAIETATLAYGFLLEYLLKSQGQSKLQHLRTPKALRNPSHLKLGPNSAQHLDLLPKLNGHFSTFSLFDWMNVTKTAFGARRLRSALLAPLKDPKVIREKQAAVRKLEGDDRLRESLTEAFTGFLDLERILGKVTTGLANPRDTYALGKGIEKSESILRLLTHHLSNGPHLSSRERPPVGKDLIEEIRKELHSFFPQLGDLSRHILKIQKESAPFHSRDGGVFERGFHPELDRLIDLTENGQRWLLDLEEKERAATGISSLKVRYNRVFGYYIEITSSHLKNAPAHYQRKQTTSGGERFFTEELKRFEDEMLSAEEKRKALETSLFTGLVEKIRGDVGEISKLTETLAELDVLLSFSRLREKASVCFPEIDESSDLIIEEGRHPLVDQQDGSFIPNSIHLSRETRTLLITGPNMGGKSTVMRQFALLILMGQMGAPIPAKSARWGVFDAIYTRIGAQDAIARGQSTFMVEMTELAHILHSATEKSFILLDEIGRGTSTYDGLSVAWGAIEGITKDIGARTLFATHYHELTTLPESISEMKNVHMAVDSERDRLQFLYEMRDGAASESFGIQVGKLAGLPRSVTDRAEEILHQLEKKDRNESRPLLPTVKALSKKESRAQAQMALFELSRDTNTDSMARPGLRGTLHPEWIHYLDSIEKLDPNSMTPLQALLKLAELKTEKEKLKNITPVHLSS